MQIRFAAFSSLALGLSLLALPLLAHHGTGVAYEVDKQVTIKGTVTEWIWANPHCGLLFDATPSR